MKGLNISKGAGKFVRGGKYLRTACVALAVSPADSDRLKRTQELYTKACNRIAKAVTADKGGEKRLWQRFNLHHATYRKIRTEIPNLGSQLVCSAIHRVATSCKSWMENNPKKKKDDPWIFPEFAFNRASIHLDKNTVSFTEDRRQASIYTLDGRITAQVLPGQYQQKILQEGRIRECNLVWKKGTKKTKSRWELHFAVEFQVKEVSLENLKEEEVLGIDVGENNLAAMSTGHLFKAGKIKDDREKYLSRRKRFQCKGTESARQALRKASGRESRHVGHINDEVSKQIVKEALSHGIKVIVLEDLTHIRDHIKAGRKVRARLHRWAFRDFQTKIEQKAIRKGLKVLYVDPKYTSKTCSNCGQLGSRKRHLFECSCGCRRHSDLNASQTIKGLGYLLISQGLVVNKP